MNGTTHRWRRGTDNYPIGDADFIDAVVDREHKLPNVLFGQGERPDAFDAPRSRSSGTRAATPNGIADAGEIAAFCATAGITVISGLAIGIDAAADQGVLDAGGLTVGVVATGLDIVYPRRHARLYDRVRKQGLVVGEHLYGVQPLPWRFPIRNRIIAALADAVVVVEATRTGGASITARDGNLYGRDVYVVPGSRRNPAAAGCNALLLDGAKPLLDPSDVLFPVGRGGTVEGGWAPPPPPQDPDQRAVMKVLGGEPATIDEIERRVTFPADRLGKALRALESRGAIERKRGLWWPR